MDYYELLWVVTPIAAAIPDVVSFLEQINTFLGTWLWQMPFSLYQLLKIITSCSAFGGTNNTPSWYYLNSPAICPNLFLREIMLVNYIVGITLFEPSELNVYFHLLQEGDVCLLYLKLPPPVPTGYIVLTDYRGGNNSVMEIPETMLKTIVLLLMFISFSWSFSSFLR